MKGNRRVMGGLPFAHRRRAGTRTMRLVAVPFDARLWQDMAAFAADQDIPLATFLLAVFLVLMHRLTGEPAQAISICSPDAAGAVNTATLVSQARDDLSFARFVAQLKAPEQASDKTPTHVLVGLQTSNVAALPPHDLGLLITQHDDGTQCTLSYAAEVLEDTDVARLGGFLRVLCAGALAHPHRGIDALPLLDAEERHLVTVAWNRTQRDLPAEQCIHHLFEAQAARVPDHIAVSTGTQALTYAQLNARANDLAAHLAGLGVGRKERVAILLERSLDMLVAVLATLKAGAAYIPLDRTLPDARLSFMIDDSAPAIVLTHTHLQAHLSPHLPWVALDTDWQSTGAASARRGAPQTTGDDLAYVIYTSGSSGRPKGVQVAHRSVVNFLASMRQTPGITESDRLLSVTTLAFDIAGLELFLPLCVGAQVRLIARSTAMNGVALAGVIAAADPTILQATPATWHMLVDAGWRGKADLKILCGGESLHRPLANQLCERGASVWNLYGPTETTIWSSVAQVSPGSGPVTIGRPIANTTMYVVNTALQPQPIGIVGELCIGGLGLSQGYLHRPDLTREKFVADPFALAPGSLMYRTGDLARYTPVGDIEWLGRVDTQVKVRGYRIELGEIETLLREHPLVRDAAVIVREDDPGDVRIVAYVCPVAASPPDVATLHAYLAGLLPTYMLPTAIVSLAALPLSHNQKVDRRSLPKPRGVQPPSAAPHPSNLPPDARVKAAWAEIVGHGDPDPDMDFFAAGGTSMQAMNLVMRLGEELGVKLSVRGFLSDPTLRGLTALLQAQHAPASAEQHGHIDPDFAQEAQQNLGIDIADTRLAAADPTRPILLTGATGFLGAFLLGDLLAQTRSDIYCLMRGKTQEDGNARIRTALTAYGLWRQEFGARVRPLLGDLTQPRLGLPCARYDALCNDVGAVYHGGARVNFLLPYTQLKAANVLGTTEILRFAAHGTRKQLHYVSTTSVFDSWRYDGRGVLWETDTAEFSDGFFTGYAASKWVAEQHVMQARAKGLPVAIYRPGMIAGASGDGQMGLELFPLFIKGCIQLGSVPDLNIALDLVPVDFVSHAITALSRRPVSLGQVFHLVHPQPTPIAALFQAVRSHGYPLRTRGYHTWLDMLTQQARHGDNVLAPLLALFAEKHGTPRLTVPQYASKPHRARFDTTHVQQGLAGTAIACPRLSPQLFKTYLDYLIGVDFLPPPAHAAMLEPDVGALP